MEIAGKFASLSILSCLASYTHCSSTRSFAEPSRSIRESLYICVTMLRQLCCCSPYEQRHAADGASKYKIPKGGFFDLVSCANYGGEIIEWTGFAIACWSLPAAAFAFYTFSNIGPRGYKVLKYSP